MSHHLATQSGHLLAAVSQTSPVYRDALRILGTEGRQLMPFNMAYQEDAFGSFRFTLAAESSIARIWVLLPEDREHAQFRSSRFPLDDPSRAELVMRPQQ